MWAELKECEKEITVTADSDQVLWRQVAPKRLQNETVLLETFIPTSDEARQLSVGLSSKIAAEDSHFRYTHDLNLSSAGVLPVSIAAIAVAITTAVENVELDVRVVDDSSCDEVPDWHGYIDFSEIETRAYRKAFAQSLWLAATTEGWAFKPTEPTDLDV